LPAKAGISSRSFAAKALWHLTHSYGSNGRKHGDAEGGERRLTLSHCQGGNHTGTKGCHRQLMG
jgi:hypothetical protein